MAQDPHKATSDPVSGTSGTLQNIAKKGDLLVNSLNSTIWVCSGTTRDTITWVQASGGSSYVALQATTPGTADTGNAHVTGVLQTDTGAKIGASAPTQLASFMTGDSSYAAAIEGMNITVDYGLADNTRPAIFEITEINETGNAATSYVGEYSYMQDPDGRSVGIISTYWYHRNTTGKQLKTIITVGDNIVGDDYSAFEIWNPSGAIFACKSNGDLYLTGRVFESVAASQAIATDGTIAISANKIIYPVTLAADATNVGIAGGQSGQRITIINNSANTLSFGGTNVAGVQGSLLAGAFRDFKFYSTTNKWHAAG